ncbi:hypothetical protein BJ912DRAFT_967840 [Pholiota molesta]|nr:hypothetical protein BJ912DRAFT_967840 [Pholiota molesta]
MSLSYSMELKEDHHTMSELYTVLHSTPAVKTLALRGPYGCDKGFLSLHKPDYPAILSTISDRAVREPFWRHAPHLTHLQLDLPWIDHQPKVKAARILDVFVLNFFLPDCRWLALDNCANPIRRVTFIAGDALTRYPDFDTVREMMMAIVSDAVVDDTGSQAWRGMGFAKRGELVGYLPL